MKNKLSIVYDITKECPLNCPICCMGAHSGKEARKGELSFEEKLELAEQFAELSEEYDIRIDFSGGEILTDENDLKIVRKASEILGKDKIGISMSGYEVDDKMAAEISEYASECEMTMDVIPGRLYRLRPKVYSEYAAKAIPHLKRHGVTVGIQTVLANSNCNESNLRELYAYLLAAGVDNWSLLKFYPSGRGANFSNEALSKSAELWSVKFIRGLDENTYLTCKPKIDFHYTMEGHKKHDVECRCVKKSIGILPNGDVTSCFWAVDSETGIISPKFNLGNVKRMTLLEIMRSEKARYWSNCAHICELPKSA